ncbi:MAG TPA: hypothetical protein VFV27_09080 [Nevskiaceae bacterium]|nr:hypothetical protein [Nevskiaceae bacterium]
MASANFAGAVAIFLALLTAGSALVALIAAFGGNRPVLSSIEIPPGVPPARVNRYAAWRLLLPVVLGAVWVPLSFGRPALAVIGLLLWGLSQAAVFIWIAIGVQGLAAARR